MRIIITQKERKNKIYSLFEEIVDKTIDINCLLKNDNNNEFEEVRDMFLIKKRYIKICENIIEIIQILTEIKYNINL